MQTATSWAATAHMVGEAWLGGAVPTRYARRTLQTAQQTLSEKRDTLQQSPSITGDRLSKALEHLQNLEATVEEMQKAVQMGDRASLGQQIKQLATEEQTLKTFTQNAGGQP
jgi:hypothetical protein